MRRTLPYLFLGLLLLISCQEEQFAVVEDNQETIYIQNGQLTRLIQAVSAHDGTFDDVLDQSPCFSINFPYEVKVNGQIVQVNSQHDLGNISMNDFAIPIYPITVTLADYTIRELTHIEQYFALKEQCDIGLLFDEVITCVNFQYPFSMAIFDPTTNAYETLVLDLDRETFDQISNLSEEILVSINFPIRILFLDGTTITINSHAELQNRIAAVAATCG